MRNKEEIWKIKVMEIRRCPQEHTYVSSISHNSSMCEDINYPNILINYQVLRDLKKDVCSYKDVQFISKE